MAPNAVACLLHLSLSPSPSSPCSLPVFVVVVAYLLSSLRRPQRGTGNINLTRLPTVVVVAAALVGDTAVSLAAAAFPLHFFCFVFALVASRLKLSPPLHVHQGSPRVGVGGSVWFGFFGFSF